jgi:hypothetical protein
MFYVCDDSEGEREKSDYNYSARSMENSLKIAKTFSQNLMDI